MEDLLERLATLRLPIRVALLVGLVLLICGGYWYFWYDDLLTERRQLEQTRQQKTTEKEDYEKRKREYLAFRNEVNQLLEQQKELVRMLPKRDDIEQFIEAINSQVELSGLSKVASVRETSVTEDIYIRIPIRMSLIGSFHAIARFFKNVGELKRIVTISDLQLHPEGTDLSRLKADFVAATFQFIDRGPQKGIILPAAAPGAAGAPRPVAPSGGAASPGGPAGGAPAGRVGPGTAPASSPSPLGNPSAPGGSSFRGEAPSGRAPGGSAPVAAPPAAPAQGGPR